MKRIAILLALVTLTLAQAAATTLTQQGGTYTIMRGEGQTLQVGDVIIISGLYIKPNTGEYHQFAMGANFKKLKCSDATYSDVYAKNLPETLEFETANDADGPMELLITNVTTDGKIALQTYNGKYIDIDKTETKSNTALLLSDTKVTEWTLAQHGVEEYQNEWYLQYTSTIGKEVYCRKFVIDQDDFKCAKNGNFGWCYKRTGPAAPFSLSFIPESHLRTYYNAARDLQLNRNENMRAATVTVDANGQCVYTHTYEPGDIIPHGTAVQLIGAQGATYYPHLCTPTETIENNLTAPVETTNWLHGYDTDHTTEHAGDVAGKYYSLTYDTSLVGLAYYWKAEEGGPFTIPAHLAYLFVPDGTITHPTDANGRIYCPLPDFDTTGTGAISRPKTCYDLRTFNLAGQQVAHPKGLVIRGGHTFLISK